MKQTAKDKIEPYVKEGLTPAEIAKITGYHYRTVLNALKHYENYNCYDLIVERPKGWNKDRCACKTCRYRNRVTVYDETLQHRCNYIFIAGHSRGAKVEDCNRYVKGRRIRMNVRWNGKAVE